jgi:hypothetical protein
MRTERSFGIENERVEIAERTVEVERLARDRVPKRRMCPLLPAVGVSGVLGEEGL